MTQTRRLVALAVVAAFGLAVAGASAQGILGIQELRIGLDLVVAPTPPSVGGAPAPPPSTSAMLSRHRSSGQLPRQRNPELSSDQIVVVADDAQGQVIDWQLVADPRVLRSEGPGPTGELEGRALLQTSTELMIAIPDNPAIVQLRLFHPRWTGTAFVLDLLGIVSLR